MVDRKPTDSGPTGREGETDFDTAHIGADEQDDFAALFEASESEKSVHLVARDSQVHGTIVSIGEEWIFVDVGAKTEGSIAKDELLDENRELTVKVGDPITAYVVSDRDGDIHLSVKMTAAATDEALKDASRSGVPVEGLVRAERKGGYTVSVLGKEAFCPFSQMDLRSGGNPESYLNKRFVFRITKYSEGGRNIVVSRREILEEERAPQVSQLKQSLEPGDLVEGTVRNIRPFGVFVDIGAVEGLVPISHLAWYRVEDPSEIVRVGDRITVKVLEADWDNNRISFSRKDALPDPWLAVAERYSQGADVVGTVTKLMNYGVFVELEPGIEGLLHVSELGTGRRINHPREVVSEGDKLEVRILSVDIEARRISLELSYADAEGTEGEARQLNVGDIVTGTVDAVKDYGIFVSMPGRRSGLLHVSQIRDGKSGDLRKRYSVGDSIDVEIMDIDSETKKIALSTKSLLKREEEAQFKHFKLGDKSEASFGTLGDLLKDKLSK